MLFGSGRRKKIETLLATGNEHAKAGNFAEARKAAAEAFQLAAEAFGDHVAAARQAQSMMVHAAVKVGDWAWAESSLERALELFEARLGPASLDTIPVRRSLLDLYERRENHDRVLALVRQALSRISDQNPEHAILRALSTPSLVALGRTDEAVETAKRAFEEARTRFGKKSEAGAMTCMQLAKVLIETGRDPATGFDLVELYRLEETPRTVDELIVFLRQSHLQAQALFAGAGLNEAARHLEMTSRRAFRPVWEAGGRARLLYGKIEALHGEALAALGQMKDAEQKVRGAIRDVEAAAGPRSPELVPMLESHARILRTKNDVRNAETQEKRAAAIRALVTGKKVAPVKQQAHTVVTTVWPRRTLAGVFHLKHASPAIVAGVITSMSPVAPDDEGFEAIPVPGESSAFIVMRGWENVWQPRVAVAAKRYAAALGQIIRLVNTGIAAAGGTQVVLEPWVAVLDELACPRDPWAPGHRERLIREVFPTLPGWQGVDAALRWLGDGVRLKDGHPRHVSASLDLSFAPDDRIHLVGLGPASLLDEWFIAFARATRLFPPETYSRLGAAPADALPLTTIPHASA